MFRTLMRSQIADKPLFLPSPIYGRGARDFVNSFRHLKMPQTADKHSVLQFVAKPKKNTVIPAQAGIQNINKNNKLDF